VVWLCGVILVQGCSLLRNPIDIPAEGMRAIRRDRVVHVTLLGGEHLNPGADGRARPVQLCVYLVTRSDWVPEDVWSDEDKCTKGANGDDVIVSERRVVAANRAQPVEMKMPSNEEGWLVVDPDFANASRTQAPLRLRVNASEYSSHLVLLDGTSAMDGYGNRPVRRRQDRSRAPADVPTHTRRDVGGAAEVQRSVPVPGAASASVPAPRATTWLPARSSSGSGQ